MLDTIEHLEGIVFRIDYIQQKYAVAEHEFDFTRVDLLKFLGNVLNLLMEAAYLHSLVVNKLNFFIF